MSKNKLPTEPYKGVRDFYPEDQSFLNYFVDTCGKVAEGFGYVEYHASILEPAELYKAKGSENEEIINEQSYTFTDRGGREVTLRPEMTPTVARMVAAKRRELGFPLRLFSTPNVFRYERPQRGRLREHWQLNVDLFGSHSPAADAEIIAVAYEIMKAFGAKDGFVIKINDRKNFDSIAEKLHVEEKNKPALIRLFDRYSKVERKEWVKELHALTTEASKDFELDAYVSVIDSLFTENSEALASVHRTLIAMGIPEGVISIDPTLARGFDYYTGIVFEVFDTDPQNNRSLFGGGRYDNLTALFDDEAITGVGFGMGDVTMYDFLEVRGLIPEYLPATQVYVAVASPDVLPAATTLAGELRAQRVRVALDFGEKKLGDQIKTAAKHKIPYLIVVGNDEIASREYTVRNLNSGEEKKLSHDGLVSFFHSL